mmetsp:Transcript_78017/g.137626  ORF Transcript_78017/g.137626 Transcript_78017/m.137626 type:complete len:200 (-) Transcript_78017:1050-1649(-)
MLPLNHCATLPRPPPLPPAQEVPSLIQTMPPMLLPRPSGILPHLVFLRDCRALPYLWMGRPSIHRPQTAYPEVPPGRRLRVHQVQNPTKTLLNRLTVISRPRLRFPRLALAFPRRSGSLTQLRRRDKRMVVLRGLPPWRTREKALGYQVGPQTQNQSGNKLPFKPSPTMATRRSPLLCTGISITQFLSPRTSQWSRRIG